MWSGYCGQVERSIGSASKTSFQPRPILPRAPNEPYCGPHTYFRRKKRTFAFFTTDARRRRTIPRQLRPLAIITGLRIIRSEAGSHFFTFVKVFIGQEIKETDCGRTEIWQPGNAGLQPGC